MKIIARGVEAVFERWSRQNKVREILFHSDPSACQGFREREAVFFYRCAETGDYIMSPFKVNISRVSSCWNYQWHLGCWVKSFLIICLQELLLSFHCCGLSCMPMLFYYSMFLMPTHSLPLPLISHVMALRTPSHNMLRTCLFLCWAWEVNKLLIDAFVYYPNSPFLPHLPSFIYTCTIFPFAVQKYWPWSQPIIMKSCHTP